MNFPKGLQEFLTDARIKAFPRDQIVLYEGDTPSEVYLIKSGAIKVHDISDSGEDKILHILNAGSVLPLAFFSGDNTPTNWFYTALTDTELYVAAQDDLRHFLIKHPDVATQLTSWFSHEVHELLVRLSSMGKTNSQDKLIAALTFLAVHNSTKTRGHWVQVEFPVTHQLLADMIGITRESTAICMKQLQKEGLIRYPRLAVLDINFDKITAHA